MFEYLKTCINLMHNAQGVPPPPPHYLLEVPAKKEIILYVLPISFLQNIVKIKDIESIAQHNIFFLFL